MKKGRPEEERGKPPESLSECLTVAKIAGRTDNPAQKHLQPQSIHQISDQVDDVIVGHILQRRPPASVLNSNE